MVRLSSSPGARIASLRSLSTYRPTTPGCAASHHLGAGDASGSAGGRWSSSSVSVEPGWSSVAATVMESWTSMMVTRFRSRPPRVVRARRVLGRGEVHDTHPRHEHMTTGAPRKGSQQGRQANKVTRGERHETHPGTSNVTTTTGRPQPNSTRQPRRKLSAPRSGSPSGQTRRAQERAPASHREERQAATPTKTAQLTPEGRRPSSSDTRSEASRITCETRAEGRPREPTAWGRGARGRFLGHSVSPES